MIRVSDVSFAYGKKEVLKGLSFKIAAEKITTILGANGSGKSTLFSLMTKSLKPDQGEVYLAGEDVSGIGLRDFSKKVAIVHQHNQAAEDMIIEKLVSYGRLPYAKRFQRKSEEDDKAIKWALKVTGLEEHQKQELGKLSGGLRQRAFIAMALAQDTKVLFLDEPTTFLDIRYQIEILELIKRLNREYQITIIMILHDINQAIYYSDNLIGLKDGKVEAQGKVQTVITEELIYQLYNIRLKIEELRENKYVLNIRGQSDRVG